MVKTKKHLIMIMMILSVFASTPAMSEEGDSDHPRCDAALARCVQEQWLLSGGSWAYFQINVIVYCGPGYVFCLKYINK